MIYLSGVVLSTPSITHLYPRPSSASPLYAAGQPPIPCVCKHSTDTPPPLQWQAERDSALAKASAVVAANEKRGWNDKLAAALSRASAAAAGEDRGVEQSSLASVATAAASAAASSAAAVADSAAARRACE